METQIKKNVLWSLLIIVVLMSLSCRSGAQVPEDVSIPIIEPTMPASACKNDQYPETAPRFGDNSSMTYTQKTSGLKVLDVKLGNDPQVKSGNIVTVNYTGWLDNGCIFDSSYLRNTPASFPIGSQAVIQGWDEGIPGMKIGGIRRLEIPPRLGYGPMGIPGVIPPNTTIIFEVSLLEIQEQ